MSTEKLGLSVQDMANQLGISRPVAYQIVGRSDFPKVRVGRRIIIPRQGLEDWLRRESCNVFEGGAAR